MIENIKQVIMLGENVNTEFKMATIDLPKSVFETVCSFLNTTGGDIIFGVTDEKEIVGVEKEVKDKIKKDFSSLCNNKEIMNPTIIAELHEIMVDGKLLLYTHIEELSEIHKYKGKVYIRNYEGDFDITNNISLIASVHNKKRKIFDEDKIYPYVSVSDDLRNDLIDKARKLANSNVNKEHPWMSMSDVELLKSANLYKIDKETGKEGVTLAGIMLFGKDNIISQINPYCRTDALYRVDDLERYDDRDFVETNLLDMYDRLLDFISKYTMDRFALDDEQKRRISPRNIIAREMVINTLMHRDITDGHTSRIIIYKDKIVCENPNSFRTMKNISLKDYTPFAKNPTLAKFFREIGYADELGSGVRKITENSLLYSGKPPIFEDKEMFKLIVPLLRDVTVEELEDTLVGTVNGTVNDTVSGTENENQEKILAQIKKNPNITQNAIAEITGISLRSVKRNIAILKKDGILERVGSDKTGYWKIL